MTGSVERFWCIEEVDEPNESQLTADEKRVDNFYATTVRKREDGFYEVRLSFRPDYERK